MSDEAANLKLNLAGAELELAMVEVPSLEPPSPSHISQVRKLRTILFIFLLYYASLEEVVTDYSQNKKTFATDNGCLKSLLQPGISLKITIELVNR